MDDERQRARRAWIRANHPDVGGDPDAFVAGLAEFDGHPDLSLLRPSARPSVVRSRAPHRIVLRKLRALRRRLAGLPPRNLR